MTRFEKPPVGTRVRFTGKPFYPPNVKVGFHNLPPVLTGTVIKSEPRDDPFSFRMLTGRPEFPISVVTLNSIIDMEYIDSDVVPESREVNVTKDVTMTVKGSKGDEYVVTKQGSNYSCTCKGYGFNRKCKHINEAKKKIEG